jgi:hypothetical protein
MYELIVHSYSDESKSVTLTEVEKLIIDIEFVYY